MKHLVKISAISALLFSFNGWANEAFDNCIAIAEEAKNNVLEPTNWSKIEDAIDKEEAGVGAEARAHARAAPTRGVGRGQQSYLRRYIEQEYRMKRLQEIQQKRIDLEYDKQEEQSKISESKRDAIKDYIELLKVCADLNVIKFEGEVELKE